MASSFLKPGAQASGKFAEGVPGKGGDMVKTVEIPLHKYELLMKLFATAEWITSQKYLLVIDVELGIALQEMKTIVRRLRADNESTECKQR